MIFEIRTQSDITNFHKSINDLKDKIVAYVENNESIIKSFHEIQRGLKDRNYLKEAIFSEFAKENKEEIKKFENSVDHVLRIQRHKEETFAMFLERVCKTISNNHNLSLFMLSRGLIFLEAVDE